MEHRRARPSGRNAWMLRGSGLTVEPNASGSLEARMRVSLSYCDCILLRFELLPQTLPWS